MFELLNLKVPEGYGYNFVSKNGEGMGFIYKVKRRELSTCLLLLKINSLGFD